MMIPYTSEPHLLYNIDFDPAESDSGFRRTRALFRRYAAYTPIRYRYIKLDDDDARFGVYDYDAIFSPLWIIIAPQYLC